MRPSIVRDARYALAVAAIAILGFAGSAPSVLAAPAANFRAFGQGIEPSTTPDCSTATGLKLCPGSDACICTPISGHGTCAAMGGPVSYTATVATDLSLGVGNCDEAFGTATLVSTTNPANKVVLNFSGTLCGTPPTANVNPTSTANALNAVYFIDGANSKGIFKNATGSGNVSGSRDANVAILGSVIGTVKLP